MNSRKSDEPCVVLEKRNGGQVWLVLLNRPQVKNAINQQLQYELYDTFVRFEKDNVSKVAILSSTSSDCFCSGADLKSIPAGSGPLATPIDRRELDIDHNPENPNLKAMTSSVGFIGVSRMLLTKPVLAAINGPCLAGGLELALWCDLRICAPQSTFGVFCRRPGVPLVDGGTTRLPKIIGLGRALDLVLTGRPVKSEEAMQMGLVNRVNDDPLQCALDMADTLCRFPEMCLKLDRMNIYKAYGIPLLESIQNESERAFNSGVLSSLAEKLSQTDPKVWKHGSFDSFKSSKL